MKIRNLLMLALLCTAITLPAYAMTLTEARSSGAVGEQLDGYVAALKPTAEVKALAADINAKRKKEYLRISKGNGQPANLVAKLAATQIAKKLKTGNMYQSADKSWKKR